MDVKAIRSLIHKNLASMPKFIECLDIIRVRAISNNLILRLSEKISRLFEVFIHNSLFCTSTVFTFFGALWLVWNLTNQ